jgi:hypothetical protein
MFIQVKFIQVKSIHVKRAILIVAPLLFLFGAVSSSSAQVTSTQAQNAASFLDDPLFGDKNQPGNQLHTSIIARVDAGISMRAAVQNTINKAISYNDRILNGKAKSAVAFDIGIANDFYDEMVEVNSLIDVTKTLIDTNPEKIVHIITLGVILYPEFAQEVYDGAALTGLMDPDDILVAALQAGADPSTVSASTAVGETSVPVAAVPIGGGIGAGGTGGGDTTVSSN